HEETVVRVPDPVRGDSGNQLVQWVPTGIQSGQPVRVKNRAFFSGHPLADPDRKFGDGGAIRSLPRKIDARARNEGDAAGPENILQGLMTAKEIVHRVRTVLQLTEKIVERAREPNLCRIGLPSLE